MTMSWIEGIKISHRDRLIAAGHDMKTLAANLVHAFLRQAIAEGFFHADMHQGNLFVKADGTIAAVDFGIMGRINRQARYWLAEILRSEEHTSELQSLMRISYAVFCMKKKNQIL